MTPAEWEWMCERVEIELKDLARKNPDKASQARDDPKLIGWFVGQTKRNLDWCGDDEVINRLAGEVLNRS